jgi:hypothetical protein
MFLKSDQFTFSVYAMQVWNVDLSLDRVNKGMKHSLEQQFLGGNN